ncbi:hypothetical protein WMY93_027587 [Mugilogobius chulae]|uniref:CCHC-type domain-containing protein n=1 Tax=Mugilogobius chulae TaxID=88201 RepID=A0AAW0N5N6_9GOBI
MYITLTSLKKSDTETITEYIIRAEQIITALKGAGEAPSEELIMAMVMRGLPEKYKPFTLMVTHSSTEMKLGEFKAKLRNFEASEDSEPIAEEAGERVLKAKAGPKKKSGAHTDLTCWRCGEKGHRKDECSKKVWCSSCKSTSHTDKACRKKERGSRCAHAQDDGGSRGRIDVRGTEGADFTFRAQTVDTSKSAQQRPIQEKGLIVDTGASSHIINDRSRFKNFDNSFKSERHSMELADGKRTFGLAQGRGDAQVHLIDSNGRRCSVTLKNALYIPSFPQELFSVKCATASGAKLIFDEGKDVLLVPDGTKFNIHVHNRMYYLQTECDESDVCNVSHDIQTWHEIMGHCNYEDILKLQDVTVGMHIKGTKRRPDKECRVCIEGKFTQMRNRDAVVKVKTPLEQVNTDLAGPTQEVGSDSTTDSEPNETPQLSTENTDLQADESQLEKDDGEKHPRVTPQASSSKRSLAAALLRKSSRIMKAKALRATQSASSLHKTSSDTEVSCFNSFKCCSKPSSEELKLEKKVALLRKKNKASYKDSSKIIDRPKHSQSERCFWLLMRTKILYYSVQTAHSGFIFSILVACFIYFLVENTKFTNLQLKKLAIPTLKREGERGDWVSVLLQCHVLRRFKHSVLLQCHVLQQVKHSVLSVSRPTAGLNTLSSSSLNTLSSSSVTSSRSPASMSRPTQGVPEKKLPTLTVPESPAFALKKRLQERQAKKLPVVVEEEEPSHVFKSHPVSKKILEGVVVKPSSPVKAPPVPHFGLPFQPKLPEHHQVELCVRTKVQSPALPDFSMVVLPEKKKPEPTKPEPFNLLIDARGAEKSSRWENMVIQEEKKQQEEATHFKARPNKEPFKPKKRRHISSSFQLLTERRARERQEFDRALSEKEALRALMEEQRRKEEEEREREEIARMRQEQVHKAQPIKHYRCVTVKKSEMPLTSYPGLTLTTYRTADRTPEAFQFLKSNESGSHRDAYGPEIRADVLRTSGSFPLEGTFSGQPEPSAALFGEVLKTRHDKQETKRSWVK